MSDDKHFKDSIFDIPIVLDSTMPVNQIDIVNETGGRQPIMVNIGTCQKCGQMLTHGHECPSESAYWHRLPPVMEFKSDAAWPWDNKVPQQSNTITMMPPPPWDELIAGQKIMNGILKAILDIMESERELRRKQLNRPPDDEKDREIDF